MKLFFKTTMLPQLECCEQGNL